MLGAELRDRKTTSDYIADSLRSAILMGRLPDGAVLNQAAVARYFGVSRVPVREAMRQLQAEGLILAEAHHQPVVRTFDIEMLGEMSELRVLIEGYLIERAIPHIDEKRLGRLEGILRQMDCEISHKAWLQLNGNFHTLLYQASGATIAMDMAEGLRLRIERYFSLWSNGVGVERSKEAGNEHRRILELVRKGDVISAKSEIEKHVMGTLERIRKFYHQHTTANAEA